MTREPETRFDGKRPDGGTDLEAFFSAARAEAELPSGDLLARIEADALGALPVAARPRRRVTRGWLEAIGGWPAMAGLAAAVCAGVWIGFSPPAAVEDLWTDSASFSALDPVSGYDFAMVGG